MDNKLLQRYSDLRAKMSALAEEESLLKLQILEGLEREGSKKIETVFGKFTLSQKVNYIYTSKVRELEEKVKLAKIKEQEQGKAKEKIIKYLTFTNKQ